MRTVREVFGESPFHFFHIVPFSPGEEEARSVEAAVLQRRTGIDCFLYSLTLHPEGFPAKKKADRLIASYQRFSAAMRKKGLRHGVLIQSIIGHYPRTDREEESWTMTVNAKGEKVRFCLLDPGYRAYVHDVAYRLAMERPCMILTDDDVRSFSPEAECFCPLHTAEFNRRAGTQYTPEQYRQLIASSAPDSAEVRLYEAMRLEGICSLMDLIRSAIDEADPAIPAGACMPYQEFREVGHYAKHIAGKDQPALLRITNGMYCEKTAPLFLAENFATVCTYREFYRDVPVLLEESDTFPQTLYSRSSCGMHAKLLSSIFAGVNASKIWFTGMTVNGYPNSEHYVRILEKNRGIYPALTQEVANSELRGVVLPASRNFPRWSAVHFECELPEKFLLHRGSPYLLPGRFGIPFRATFGPGTGDPVLLVSGDELYRFSDEELRTMLSGRVLLMNDASAELTRRGFAGLLGCRVEMRSCLFNRERVLKTNRVDPLSAGRPCPCICDPAEGAEVLSILQYAPSAGTPAEEQDAVGPGCVIFRNELGGTVCTTVADPEAFCFYREERRDYFIGLLDRLAPGGLPFVSANEQTMMLLHRVKTDGTHLLALFNLNFDPAENVRIRCPGKPARLQVMDGAGQWQDVPFTMQGNVLVLDRTMACYDCLLLKVAL